ncbi:acyl-CoA thioesterase [Niabella terrae]
MFTAETTIRVRYAETDQMGVVYHGNYFQYFEVSRAESIRQLGFTYADMEKMGVVMPVVEVQCRYLRPAFYDELLTVTVRLRELPQDHKVWFEQELYNERKELLASARILLYFIDAQDRSRSKMPEALHKRFTPYFSADDSR